MLAKHCLEEFKLDCQLRRLTERIIKGYYNNTLNFLIYAEKHHSITEIEEIYTLHIKHYVQYLLSKKLTAAYTNNILKCLRAYFRFAIQACLRNGLDLYSVSRLLGHENINITKRYLQSLEDHNIVEMAAKASPLFNLRM